MTTEIAALNNLESGRSDFGMSQMRVVPSEICVIFVFSMSLSLIARFGIRMCQISAGHISG